MKKPRAIAAGLTVSATLLVATAWREGYKDEAYPDPATRGAPWTIGFGETRGVKPGDRTDPLKALSRLDASLREHAAGVAGCIKQPLSQGEFDASVDLAYNIGVGAFCRSSVADSFNRGDYWGGCLAVLAYNKARINGQLQAMPGLQSRRWAYYNICIEG